MVRRGPKIVVKWQNADSTRRRVFGENHPTPRFAEESVGHRFYKTSSKRRERHRDVLRRAVRHVPVLQDVRLKDARNVRQLRIDATRA